MDFIFNEIITDLIQFDFFSEYKFRKRDSSLILKTKEGKQIIELDHWIDVAKTSIVIYLQCKKYTRPKRSAKYRIYRKYVIYAR